MNGRPRVLVDPHPRRMSEIFSPRELERLHELADVIWGRDDPMPIVDAREAISSSMATVTNGWRYGEASNALTLRAIIDVSGGFPAQLDYASCFARGIRVLSVASAFGTQVAEMALGLALAATRQIAEGDRAMHEGREQYLHAGNQGTFLLFGKNVGFVGFGSLGRSLKPLLAPFGCRISVFDTWLPPGFLRSQGVEPVTLEALMEDARVIFILASPTSENRALISRSLLERIQPGAVLVLMSRAHVIDFDAMTELVLDGRFRAAIDVFPEEPLQQDHPIRRAAGAVLSAHRAGSVREGLWLIGEMLLDDLEAIISDLPPQRLQVAQPETIRQRIQR